MESKPIWKAELLSGTFSTKQRDTLREHLLEAHPLLMCSNGGAKQGNTGSFGWVIATSGKALWESIGTATGWYANSLRSEGIGQLALLVFLETYTTYYQLQNIPPPQSSPSEPWIRIATDNQGLITRIKEALASPTKFAGAGLASEYDVVNEIVEITRRLPIPLVWEHVKGHQDARKKWYELNSMEKLNVQADKHATTGLNADLASQANPR
jgi:hypothetical protein